MITKENQAHPEATHGTSLEPVLRLPTTEELASRYEGTTRREAWDRAGRQMMKENGDGITARPISVNLSYLTKPLIRFSCSEGLAGSGTRQTQA